MFTFRDILGHDFKPGNRIFVLYHLI